jgi:hypothetical protein
LSKNTNLSRNAKLSLINQEKNSTISGERPDGSFWRFLQIRRNQSSTFLAKNVGVNGFDPRWGQLGKCGIMIGARTGNFSFSLLGSNFLPFYVLNSFKNCRFIQ